MLKINKKIIIFTIILSSVLIMTSCTKDNIGGQHVDKLENIIANNQGFEDYDYILNLKNKYQDEDDIRLVLEKELNVAKRNTLPAGLKMGIVFNTSEYFTGRQMRYLSKLWDVTEYSNPEHEISLITANHTFDYSDLNDDEYNNYIQSILGDIIIDYGEIIYSENLENIIETGDFKSIKSNILYLLFETQDFYTALYIKDDSSKSELDFMLVFASKEVHHEKVSEYGSILMHINDGAIKGTGISKLPFVLINNDGLNITYQNNFQPSKEDKEKLDLLTIPIDRANEYYEEKEILDRLENKHLNNNTFIPGDDEGYYEDDENIIDLDKELMLERGY